MRSWRSRTHRSSSDVRSSAGPRSPLPSALPPPGPRCNPLDGLRARAEDKRSRSEAGHAAHPGGGAIAPEGVAALEARHAVDVRTGLSPEELRGIVGAYEALIVRSGVEVGADL